MQKTPQVRCFSVPEFDMCDEVKIYRRIIGASNLWRYVFDWTVHVQDKSGVADVTLAASIKAYLDKANETMQTLNLNHIITVCNDCLLNIILRSKEVH